MFKTSRHHIDQQQLLADDGHLPFAHNQTTGRLHQVEYAIEAINNAGTCVGILCKDGIVLAGT